MTIIPSLAGSAFSEFDLLIMTIIGFLAGFLAGYFPRPKKTLVAKGKGVNE